MDKTSNLKAVNQRAKGGLILKRTELQAILEEEGAVGLAFSVEAPGQAYDVRLKVYKVVKKEEGLEGELREIDYQKGASGLGELADEATSYCFECDEVLIKKGFDFSYIPKDRFNRLFLNGEDEVFIAGAVRDYGTLLKEIVGKWFTLTITPRWNPVLEKFLGTPPSIEFSDPCPPFWRPGSGTGDGITLL